MEIFFILFLLYTGPPLSLVKIRYLDDNSNLIYRSAISPSDDQYQMLWKKKTGYTVTQKQEE